uniref:Uncharacterized protein n=1 Tax=Timema genevievae TaxID=629358 RepID=A0A7R9JWU4_TIMGE|nr:unnamed protein product [Timema genevievae]
MGLADAWANVYSVWASVFSVFSASSVWASVFSVSSASSVWASVYSEWIRVSSKWVRVNQDKIMVLSYLAVIFVAVVLYFLTNWIKCVMAVWGLPGPPAVPVLGHALLASDNKRLVHMGSNAYLEYGPLVKIWLTFFPTVLVLSPEYLQPILSSSKHTDKSFFYKLLDNFLGTGLVTSNVHPTEIRTSISPSSAVELNTTSALVNYTTEASKDWRSHRRLLQPSFHQGVLEMFLAAFHDGSQRLVNRFKDTSSPVNITRHMNETVLEILNGRYRSQIPQVENTV